MLAFDGPFDFHPFEKCVDWIDRRDIFVLRISRITEREYHRHEAGESQEIFHIDLSEVESIKSPIGYNSNGGQRHVDEIQYLT